MESAMESDQAVYLRFSRYYYQKLHQAETAYLLDQDNPVQGLALLDRELTQILQAQAYIGKQLGDHAEHDQHEIANLCLAYASVNDRILELRLNLTERIEWYSKALKAAELLNDLNAIRHAAHQLGTAYRFAGNYDEAMHYYQRGFELAEAMGNKAEQANIWMGIAAVTAYRGDYTGAETSFNEVIALMREIGATRSLGEALNHLGNVYTGQNKIDLARQCFADASTIFRECQDLHMLAITLSGVGMCYRLTGNLPESMHHLSESLLLARQLGASRSIGVALAHLGLVMLNMGQTDLGLAHLKESATLLKMTGDRFVFVLISAFLLYHTLSVEALTELTPQLLSLVDLAVKMRAVGNLLAVLVSVAKWYLLADKVENCIEILNLVDARPELDPEWLPYIAKLSTEVARRYPNLNPIDIPSRSLDDIVQQFLATKLTA